MVSKTKAVPVSHAVAGRPRARGARRTAAFVVAATVAVAAVRSRNSQVFIPGVNRAVMANAAALLIGVASMGGSPALAEEKGKMDIINQDVAARDAGLKKIESEAKALKLSPADLDKLEKDEIALAKKVEKEQIAKAEAEEKKLKVEISQTEKEEKAAIDKEEKKIKEQIEKDLKSQLADVEKTEKAAKTKAKSEEAEEKKVAIADEKAAKKTAKTEAERITVENDREARVLSIVDKSEQYINTATESAEDAVKQAYKNAEDKRVAATETAESLRKTATQKAEAAFDSVVEKTEKTERAIVETEESLEQKVVKTVEAAEKAEVKAEEEYLDKIFGVLMAIRDALLPVVLPGIVIAIYAVITSFFAPAPEPAKGGEAKDVRDKMGRKARVATSKPKDEYGAPAAE